MLETKKPLKLSLKELFIQEFWYTTGDSSRTTPIREESLNTGIAATSRECSLASIRPHRGGTGSVFCLSHWLNNFDYGNSFL
jgi:hypothetical protein